ncbi:DUF3243 domain-containing protein [Hazenella sp. IB182357]|uniref:DUF3243 domain-containing protein n=1 Tax=Polycladospora coralii TaxID=2771432 RepID=A0A926NI13_9BACL|nr:DUF3243 domain-containing protein [Polycladospora coralii]MBD1373653.1 DUF3243 domain-containing protein [Polycladospora coralii]MBS7530834.1 DUF3243 domain-containing protein [Polycladospora coralii]
MAVLDNFEQWKEFLHNRVNQAETLGMDRENISELAYQLGDYLAQDIDPQNREEHLLKDLWNCANEEEQKIMANLMVKLVNDGK